MSRIKTVNFQTMLSLLAAAALALVSASGAHAQQTQQEVPLLSANELEDLVARVALYPDELLGIVLPASTYPLQIVEASRFLDAREQDDTLEPDPEWDDAIVALLNYPEALELMNDDLDWTWQLGEAVLAQQGELLEAVESFRDNAFLAGNLVSDERQQVARDDTGIRISTTEPDVIYVPYYDPVQVVVRHDYPALYYHDFGYPLYYYPYAASHRFNRGFFFGVSTAFAISWRHRYLHLHYYDHRGHPFFGRNFGSRWFFRHRSNLDYRLFAGNRRFAHQGNLYRWYPGRGYGVSPRNNRYRANNNRRTLRYANNGSVNRAQQRANRRARYERRNYRTFDNVVDQGRNRANGNRVATRNANRDAVNTQRRTNRQTQRAQVNRRSDRNRVADNQARRSRDGATALTTTQRQDRSNRNRYTTQSGATNQTRQRNRTTTRGTNDARQPAKERYQRSVVRQQPVKQYATPQRSQARAQNQRSNRQTQTRQTQNRQQRAQPVRQSQSRQRSSNNSRSSDRSSRSTNRSSSRSSDRSSRSTNRSSSRSSSRSSNQGQRRSR